MIGTGLDYSAGVLTSAQIRAAGHTFCIRYTDAPLYCGRKHVSAPEYAELTRGGIDVHLVFEVATTDMLGGAAAGSANARRALDGAASVGHAGLIFMACDMHLTPAQIPACLDYLRAAEAVLGHDRTGVYGFSELIASARSAGLGSVFWQCGHDPGLGAGVHVWQRNDVSPVVGGIACDVNVQYLPTIVAGPQPTPPLSVGEDVTQVDITYYDDSGNPDPAGLNFRGALPAEASGTSAVIAAAWVRWLVKFGTATGLRVVAWDATKPIGQAPPSQDWWQLPATVRGFTVEGRRENAGTMVAFVMLTKPK